MTDNNNLAQDRVYEVPICGKCGSERVVTDAWACWNSETGQWALENSFDQAYCHDCEAETTLNWLQPDRAKGHTIQELNDAFRARGIGQGVVLVTDGIASMGEAFVAKTVSAVRRFNTFNADNDPHCEHDFGAIELEGQKIFWKLDLYDLDMQGYTPDPCDPALTRRVLTIMLASEY